MAEVAGSEEVADEPVMSAVFGNIDTKIKAAVRNEVARRFQLGLPVVVDEGRGIEDLSTSPAPSHRR